jgi:hypothetical protein
MLLALFVIFDAVAIAIIFKWSKAFSLLQSFCCYLYRGVLFELISELLTYFYYLFTVHCCCFC